jgi:hypothetical protein
MKFDYYIKFGNLDSEWVDSWNLGGFPLPAPPPDKELPPPPFTDAVVALRYSRLFLSLQTIMVTGMVLENAALVTRNIDAPADPKITMVVRFQKVIIDACLPATDISGPRIYFGYDSFSVDYTSFTTALPPRFNQRWLTLGPRALA